MGENKIPSLMEKVTPILWFVVLAVVGLSLLVLAPATVADEPPEGAVTANIGFPPVGAKLKYRTVVEPGETRIQTFTMLEEGTYEDKPVYRMSDGVETILYDKATRNLVAKLHEGKVIREFSPHAGTFSSPIWVGKSWVTTFTFTNYERERTRTRTRECKVEAYEEVKVPAGSFKAFRVKCSDERTTINIWYSPEIKQSPKVILERWGRRRGRKKETRELLEYRPK